MDIKTTKTKLKLKEQRSIQIMMICFAISITCMIIVLSAKILLAMNKKEVKQPQSTKILESKA